MASSNLSFTDTKNKYYYIWMIGTVLLLIGGIYIIYKHHKTPGFWWGLGAMILIGSSVYISDNATKLNIAGFSLDVTSKDKNKA